MQSDPTLIAGLGIAASTAGSAINANAQNRAAEAQIKANNETQAAAIDATEAKRKRQAALDDRSFAEVWSAIADVDSGADAELVAEEAADPTVSEQEAATRYAPLFRPTTSTGGVQGGAGKLRDKADTTKAMIDALAVLNRQGVGSQGISDQFGRFWSNLATQGDKARRSMRVAHYEATTVTSSYSMFSDILRVGRNLASIYGGSKLDAGEIPNPFKGWPTKAKSFTTAEWPAYYAASLCASWSRQSCCEPKVPSLLSDGEKCPTSAPMGHLS